MSGGWDIGGMILTNVVGEEPVPGPLCSTQITNGLSWDRTRPSKVWLMLCRNIITNHSKDDSERINASNIFVSNMNFPNT
jgi:hypothetical protein